MKIRQLQQQAREIGHEGWNPLKGLQIGNIFSSVGSFFRQIDVMLLLIMCCVVIIYLAYRIIMCIIRRSTKTYTPFHAVYRVKMVNKVYENGDYDVL